jgi:hypothetical protein
MALAGVLPVLLALPGVAAALNEPAAAPPPLPQQQQQQVAEPAVQALEALVGREPSEQAEGAPGAARLLQLLQTRPLSGAAALLAAAAALPAQAVAFHAAPSTSGHHPQGVLRYTMPQAAVHSGAPGTSAAAAAGSASAAAAVAAAEAALAVLPDDNPGAVSFALLLLHQLLLYPEVGAALKGRRGTLQLLGLCQDRDQDIAAMAAALCKVQLWAGGPAAAAATAAAAAPTSLEGLLQRASLSASSEPMVGGAAACGLQPLQLHPGRNLLAQLQPSQPLPSAAGGQDDPAGCGGPATAGRPRHGPGPQTVCPGAGEAAGVRPATRHHRHSVPRAARRARGAAGRRRRGRQSTGCQPGPPAQAGFPVWRLL